MYSSLADALLPHPTDTYWAEFHAISKHNLQLTYLERLWAAWYAYIGNDVLATGIMSFLMHEMVYFGRCIPWMIIDRIPAFNRYKIQNVSVRLAVGV
jgi:methylsterol monooxygenase